VKRNWESVVLKAFGGKDFRLTVLESESIEGHYQRLRLDGGGLLEACGLHPTMWIRLWFDYDGKPHQRAYTLVDPDPATGQFSIEFALHDGTAARWSVKAAPGDVIDATVQGTGFALPDPAPTQLFVAGDAASIPAINSLLDAAASVPATVWLEFAHEGEKSLPLRNRTQQTVTWVPRREGGQHFVEAVTVGLSAQPGAHYWVACEAATTRALNKHIRRTLGVDKHSLTSLGYWTAK